MANKKDFARAFWICAAVTAISAIVSASFSVVPSNAPAKIVSLCASKGFNVNGYEYQVTDDYNGEEKRAQTIQGVSVTAPGKPKDVTFSCRIKPKADYTDLQAALPGGQE